MALGSALLVLGWLGVKTVRERGICAWSRVQQKVSGRFRAFAGAETFARIHGYLSPLRKQGLPVLSALEATLQGHLPLPSLQTT